MTQRTKTIDVGEYEVRDETNGVYVYRAISTGRNKPWKLVRRKRGAENDAWVFIDGEFNSKNSAIDYALERIEEGGTKPDDVLEHIDDMVDLDN